MRRALHTTAVRQGANSAFAYGRGIKVPWSHKLAVEARTSKHATPVTQVVPQQSANPQRFEDHRAMMVRPCIDNEVKCPEVVLFDGRVTTTEVTSVGWPQIAFGPLTQAECRRLCELGPPFAKEQAEFAKSQDKDAQDFLEHLELTPNTPMLARRNAQGKVETHTVAAKQLYGWYAFCYRSE
jgi:hypothetical protein